MLTDSYFRKHDYVRISITDKCNLRCRYCIPPTGVKLLPHDQILRNEEFIKLIKIFVKMGVGKIRFTGGEPLIRKGFIDIISETRNIFPGITLCLTTNGILLGEHIDGLLKNDVKKLNISLDTLSKEKYKDITGRDNFDTVISNILTAEKTGFFDLKVNCVLFKSTLKELDDFLDFFKEKNISLRFIERMPFTDEDEMQSFINSDLLIDALKTRGKLSRNSNSDTHVAKMFDFIYRGKYKMNIGVIPPVSHKFCSSCNRLRLTSDGLLKTCLHSSDEFSLLDHIRKGSDDEKIKKVIIDAVFLKNKEHDIEICDENGGCKSLTKNSSMSKIGG